MAFKYLNPAFRNSENSLKHVGQHLTIQNAAYTPAQMLRASESGIPINNFVNDAEFFDGLPNMNYDSLCVSDLRGTTLNDVWNASKDSQARIRAANKRDKSLYGDVPSSESK